MNKHSPQHYETRIRRVLQYIHDNPAGDLSLDALSDVACMSRFHWQRVFRSMTGESCAQATRRIRAYRAACLLVQTDQTLEQIAEGTGYAGERSLARNFQHYFNQTPAAYRKTASLPRIASFTSPTGEKSMYDINIENRPGLRLAGLPHQGSYMHIGRVFEDVIAVANSRNLWPQVDAMVGVYYDDPGSVEEDALKSHACLALKGDTALPEGLEDIQLPANKTAVLRFKGPYAELPKAYEYLYGKWLAESGMEPADSPAFEVYLNSPADTAPEELLTDVCVPLAS